MGAKPKLTVCITTYNHVDFIAKAMSSALAQQTDFDVEILVGEDDSTDGTREIVREYASRHPERIRAFFNDRSKVIYINRRPTGRWNLVNLITHSRGKYIALLDGDDYWTDPKKLQLQVELLDSRKDCSFVFHNAIELDEEDGKQRPFTPFSVGDHAPPPIHAFLEDHPYDISLDELFFTWIVPTASIVFRRSMLDTLPEWFFKAISGDHTLQLLLAKNGNALFLNRKMSVYRKHPGGATLQHSSGALRRSWARMHHEFNKANHYEYNNILAGRLAREFQITSDLRSPNNANVFAAFSDLFLCKVYLQKAGGPSKWLTPKLLAEWAKNLVIGTFTKAVKRIKN